MSQIHINRAGQNLGTFTLEAVQEGLQAGRFIGSDLGWRAGMETWLPLSAWPDLTIAVEPPPLVAPLGMSETPGTPPLLQPLIASGEALREGPSWEKREQIGWLQALGLTIKEVLFSPETTFLKMKREGGLFWPLVYFVITGFVGSVFAQAYNIIYYRLNPPDLAKLPSNFQAILQKADYSSAFSLGHILENIIIWPIMLVLGALIASAILHVLLLMMGGANKPFEVTFRAFCYSVGSSLALFVIPVCGWLIALIWGVICLIFGLSGTQETDTWRAVLAVLLPFLLCCGAFIGFIIFIIGIVSAAGGNAWH